VRVEAPVTKEGRLVLVVGPSGVGKDTLIAYCRSRLGAADGVVFPRRAITRPSGDDTEDHEVVSEEEFRHRAAAGGFALHWRAHGLSYGVPADIAEDIAAGRTVVVNVSRSIIDAARQRFPDIRIVHVTAAPDILARRLQARGRESAVDMAARLDRATAVEVTGSDVVHIDNSGLPEDAGKELLTLLTHRNT
jgi:ribose 1,5-bisphosphokinase